MPGTEANTKGSSPKPLDEGLEGALCYVCRAGHLRAGTYSNLLERGGAVVVVKAIPGWVCDSCGEGYADEATTDRLLAVAEDAFQRGAEVEVLRFSLDPRAEAA